MICPKCKGHAYAIETWTAAGRKLTIPRVRLWTCVNSKCLHQWPREFSSSIEEVA